ncbi:PDZ and LIM domain protein Zasp [Prorops nasuta]|uniref:PDZ and LIM domain protein Zasp n=1 Tax=Prorops nasuta TaxID=863751 RepID=UPI0034CD1833
MAQLISVKLSRFDGSPWGFRLQGGKDFGSPLVVQKVNGGSPAEAAGLRAGDAVIKVNNTEMFNLRHKDAQDVIVRAGNNFEIVVQRGGCATWRPSVSPVTPTLPSPTPTASLSNISPVTKTSLAKTKPESPLIGSGHNFSPKPYLNGTGEGPIKSIVNKQYNSPVGIYSEETIAETLSAQAEVLAGGVLGVNFKKNEKNYNAENSEVFKMVQEADKEPKTPEPVPSRTEFYSYVSHAVGGRATSPRSPTPMYHALTGGSGYGGYHDGSITPTRPVQDTRQEPSSKASPTPLVICTNCDQIIVGVFVRIKEKNLHVECFKCATCGTSLKNVGYYNINNKLYCDIHAKMVARQTAPAGLTPITVPPGGKAPAGTISAALAHAPLSPPLSNHGSSPQPFSACNRTSPDHGYHQPWRATNCQYTNGCMKNGDCNGESKTFTSTLTIQTGGTEVGNAQVNFCPFVAFSQAPTTNSLIGPKPFGGSSIGSNHLSPSPISNSGSNALPRLQSQTVTGKSCEDSCEKSYYYEVVEETGGPEEDCDVTRTEQEESIREDCSTVKNKRLAWPPAKQIEDVTYPTASPLYIDPNPVLDRRSRQAVREKKASIEACERVLRQRRRSVSIEREDRSSYKEFRHSEDTMDRVSCPGPVYKRVEVFDSTRQSRSENISRPSSTDSVRRSLTPTRIAQPIPRPWTATVSASPNLYEQTYPIPEPPKVCKKITREVKEQICERSRGSQPYREEHRAFRSEVCRREQSVCPKPPLPTPPPPKPEPPAQKECIRQVDTKTVDLRSVMPEDDTDAGGMQGEHDLVTETTEEDINGTHVKKSTVYERTVSPLLPERPPPPAPVAIQEECRTVTETKEEETVEEEQTTEEIFQRSTTTVERHREEEEGVEVCEEKTVTESAETVTSAVDTLQLVEQAKRDEEERIREEEEAERRKEEEARRRKEEEERRRREEAEKKRREEEEEERKRREEEERSKKHVSFGDLNEDEVEVIREQPLGRTYVKEEQVTETENEEGKKKTVKETYEEVVEEVLVHERVRRRDVDDEVRRSSLRDQVEAHKSIRDQNVPHKSKFGSSAQESMETCKKHVQFVKQTDSGPQPLSTEGVKNGSPKEWKSEMVNALTIAPDQPHAPLTKSTIKEVYTEETIYLDRRTKPKPPGLPALEPRPISPFQAALTTAPERSYTPLGQGTASVDQYGGARCDTPNIQVPDEGYCTPADILYTETLHKEVCTKKAITVPPPLPTPPPDFRFRDSSASPCRSRPETPARPRPETPSGRSLIAGLKKPDAIPSYQQNLVAMRRGPVEAQPYVPSRTPTPTPCRTKSPAPGPPEPPCCYVRAQAPRIRDDPPVKRAPQFSSITHFPGRKENFSFKEEEDTSEGHKSSEYIGSKSVQYSEGVCSGRQKEVMDAQHSQYHEKRCMTSEDKSESCTIKRQLHVCEEYEKCDKRARTPTPEPEPEPEPWPPVEDKPKRKSSCAISGTSQTQPNLVCPFKKSADKPRPTYSSSTEVKHVTYDKAAPCPETGLTVLPCKAHSDQGSKVGVVVVPCDAPRSSCKTSGICVTASKDRSGVCVSPCFDLQAGSCGQPSGVCGRQSAGCDFDVRNCSDPGICVTPCPNGGVCVAPCTKPAQCPKREQCRASAKANIPFPQIPLPYEDDKPRCEPNFGPVSRPKTNLSGQLARLTAKQNIPTIQLYKPQAQCQTQTQIQSQTKVQNQSQCETQRRCHTEYRRETRCQTQSHCHNQSQNQCQTQNHCQDQYHCPSNKTQSLVDPPNLSSHPDLGSGVGGLGGSKSGSFAGSSAPKRGRGILNQAVGAGSRVPLCGHCNAYVRGPFITALGQIWCPDHFVCTNNQCRRALQDIGFVEEKGQLYCEYCFERFIAPACNKCNNKIKGDCLNAIGKHFHPECFNCTYCGKLFGNSPFFLEEGLPYCEADWNELFTTKCFACGFPVEAGDRWVEALSNNYHSQCFNCTMCKKNLEGQSFYAKGGRPFCKNHAR